MFETLENRRMFAVTADAFHSTLYVWGDANSNGISVVRDGTDLVAKRYVGGSGYVEFFRVADTAVNTIRIYGYAGNDTIQIGSTVTDAAHVYGGSGGDWIQGGGGASHLWGHGNWSEDPSGQHNPATDDAAGDTLISGRGHSELRGQRGNDTLITDTHPAPSSYDMMFGGEGSDTFHVTGHGETAYAFGDGGNDTFRAAQSATQRCVFQGGTGSDTVDYDGWTVGIYARPDDWAWSGLRTDVANRRQAIRQDVEVVRGTNYADHFHGLDNANTFHGRGGNDTMYGNGGNDRLYGDGGADRIFAGAGHDTVYGGSGNDELFGEADNDALYGESGADHIYSGSGRDTLVGGSGSDWLYANDGSTNDRLYGGNTDGSGNAGYTDRAIADADWFWLFTLSDTVTDVEGVTWV